MKKFLPWLLGGVVLWLVLRNTATGQTILDEAGLAGGGGSGSNSSNTSSNNSSQYGGQTASNPLQSLLGNSGLGQAFAAALKELAGNVADLFSSGPTPNTPPGPGGTAQPLPPGIPYNDESSTVTSQDISPAPFDPLATNSVFGGSAPAFGGTVSDSGEGGSIPFLPDVPSSGGGGDTGDNSGGDDSGGDDGD